MVGCEQMGDIHRIADAGPNKAVVVETLVRETDVELTPKAEAKAANKLPKAEQLDRFEKDLEAHDGGNQPA